MIASISRARGLLQGFAQMHACHRHMYGNLYVLLSFATQLTQLVLIHHLTQGA